MPFGTITEAKNATNSNIRSSAGRRRRARRAQNAASLIVRDSRHSSDQQRRNQEAGEDEEDVHSQEPAGEDREPSVEHHHRQHGDGTHAIESRQVREAPVRGLALVVLHCVPPLGELARAAVSTCTVPGGRHCRRRQLPTLRRYPGCSLSQTPGAELVAIRVRRIRAIADLALGDGHDPRSERAEGRAVQPSGREGGDHQHHDGRTTRRRRRGCVLGGIDPGTAGLEWRSGADLVGWIRGRDVGVGTGGRAGGLPAGAGRPHSRLGQLLPLRRRSRNMAPRRFR